MIYFNKAYSLHATSFKNAASIIHCQKLKIAAQNSAFKNLSVL